MRKSVLLICICFVCILNTGCQKETSELSYVDNETTITYSNLKSVESIIPYTSTTDLDKEEYIEFWRETRKIGNIESLELSWNENDAYLSIYFNDKATREDILGIMGFYSSVILSDFSGYYKTTYEFRELINTQNVDDKILKIYVDEKLIIRTRHKFDEQNLIVDNEYFENNLIELHQRDELILPEVILEKIESFDGIKKVSASKALKPFTIFLQIEFQKKQSMSTNDHIEYLEKQLSSLISNEIYNQLNDKEINTLIISYTFEENIIMETKVLIIDSDNLEWSTNIW